MAGEPIGYGEEKNLKDGNSLLTTYNSSGKEVKTPLWIVQFSTDIDLQIDTAQIRKGLVHRPIRFSERFLTFTSIWNVKDRPKLIKLGQKLREHWVFNLNESGKPTPMIFKYFGASKTWKGFIENWAETYAVTDVILAQTSSMRIITTPDKAIPASSRTPTATGIPYAPTAGDIKDYGSDWMTGKYFNIANDLTDVKIDKNKKKEGTKGGQTAGGGGKRGGGSSALAAGEDSGFGKEVGAEIKDDQEWAKWYLSHTWKWSPDDPSGYFVQAPGSDGNINSNKSKTKKDTKK